jgi:hypothetical protein
MSFLTLIMSLLPLLPPRVAVYPGAYRILTGCGPPIALAAQVLKED